MSESSPVPSTSPPAGSEGAAPARAPSSAEAPHASDSSREASGARGSGSSSAPAPKAATLYEQLTAAQASSGGTAAAAAILLAKSKELLGFSEGAASPSASQQQQQQAAAGAVDTPQLVESASQLLGLDEATKAQFARESAELQEFSAQLLASEGGAAVAGVWNSLAERYNTEGSGLQNEALNLWTQLYSSSEAQELTDTSLGLLNEWKEFAATADGMALLEQSGEALKAQSNVLAQLLAGLTMGGAASQPSVSPTNADSSPSARSVSSIASSTSSPARLSVPSGKPSSRTPSPAPAAAAVGAIGGALAHKDHLVKTTNKVTAALADDEDVKELLSKSSALLQSYGQEEAKNRSQSPSSKSKSKSGASAASDADPTSADATASAAGDAASTALKASESYLKSLRESETGHLLLGKAAVLLQQNRDLLRPEALSSFSGSLASDANARNTFITRVKNVALDFLLSYLPTVVVPPIVSESDSLTYEIANVDLSGFTVDSEHVVVSIDGDSLHVRATDIACHMKNLLWKYQMKSFPRLSGSGTADAHASHLEFVLKLKLAYPKWEAEQAEKRRLEREKERAERRQQGGKDGSAAAASSPVSSSDSSSKSSVSVSAAQSPTSVSSAGARSPANPAASPSPVSSPAAASASASAAAAAGAPAVSASPAPSMGESLLATVSTDLGQPTLVLHSCHVRLHALSISIHSGWGKSLYNRLLALFNESVKSYMQASLNEQINEKSAYLLETVNALALDYLPLLQRIMVKATTAALAEDKDEEATAAAAGESTAATAASSASVELLSPGPADRTATK